MIGRAFPFVQSDYAYHWINLINNAKPLKFLANINFSISDGISSSYFSRNIEDNLQAEFHNDNNRGKRNAQ